MVAGPLNVKRHPKAAAVTGPAADPRLDEGIRLFNDGHHWHAHEAWEPLWMGLEGDDKLFLQGLIMAAAMLHQYGRRLPAGVRSHWQNVRERIPAGLATKWGIELSALLEHLATFATAAERQDWSLQTKAVQIRRR